MISTIVGFVNNYKYELIGGTWGYLLAYKEKNLRWGRYAKTIATHPLYAFMGIGNRIYFKKHPYTQFYT